MALAEKGVVKGPTAWNYTPWESTENRLCQQMFSAQKDLEKSKQEDGLEIWSHSV